MKISVENLYVDNLLGIKGLSYSGAEHPHG